MEDSISIISVFDLSFKMVSQLILDRKHLISVQFALCKLKADNSGVSFGDVFGLELNWMLCLVIPVIR